MPSSLEINHLDLFAGIGGFSLALKNVFTGKIITGYSEIDKYAIKIFQKQFPDAINYGNIKLIREQGLPRFNLITFGFPCQDISIAGKRVGLQGSKRSSLFFEAIRIIDANRPDYFIAENVKGLFSSHNGEDFLTALRAITDIGYDCQWQLLNTKWFLPQNRERVFIVGHLREQSRPKVFPIGEGNEKSREGINEISYAIDSNYYKGSNQDNKGARTLIQVGNVDTRGHNSLWGRVYNPDGIASSINSEGGGLGAKTGLYMVDTLQPKGNMSIFEEKVKDIYAGTQEKNTVKTLSFLWQKVGTEAFTKWGLRILDSFQKKEILQSFLYGSSIRYKTSKEKSQMDDSTLARSEIMPQRGLLYLWERKCERCPPQEFGLERQFIKELTEIMSLLPQQNSPLSIRRLTPLEAERLQGFPDGWSEYGSDGKKISDTQRYKTLGNAITVPVVEEIIRRIFAAHT